MEVLKNSGFDASTVKSRGYASMLINHLMHRKDLGLTTPKQINLLKRYGFKNVSEWKKTEAIEVIGQISSNNWKVPKWIKPQTYTPESSFTW